MIKFRTDIMRIFLALAVLTVLQSCDNEFEDFEEQNVYFPIQFPLRTINLIENSYTDNSIDLDRAFSIGVSVGGLRENGETRTINVRLAPELTDGITFEGGEDVEVLPPSYYSLSNDSQITIPSGSFNGTIRVQLTDAFFEDPKATQLNYVIPMVIEPGDYDVISGDSSIENPNRLNNEDWEAGGLPKDYTLFAVKYINKYSGIYLVKGEDTQLDPLTGDIVESATYNEPELTRNATVALKTISLNAVSIERLGANAGALYKMIATIDESGNVTISTPEGALLGVTGSGRFVTNDDTDAESWGGQSRSTLFLDYEYQTFTGATRNVKDTLVFRNDGIKFETFDVVLED